MPPFGGIQFSMPAINFNSDSMLQQETNTIKQQSFKNDSIYSLQQIVNQNVIAQEKVIERHIVAPTTSLPNSMHHPGEIIPSRCYVYHTISDLASLISEKSALSIEAKSTKAKIFISQGNTIIAFMQGENDLQLLVNQQEQIQNILDQFHKEGQLTGNLIDYQIIRGNLLYLLYQSFIIILDISALLSPQPFSYKPQIIDQLGIKDHGQFYRMESANDDNYLILIHRTKALLLQIGLSDSSFHTYRIENEDSRIVRDIEIHKNFICTLYDKNEVIVYDVNSKNKIFRAIFKDAMQQVTRLFYVTGFDDDIELEEDKEEDYNRFLNDEVVNDEDEDDQATKKGVNLPQSQALFKGHFLFVENQINKPQKMATIGTPQGSRVRSTGTDKGNEKQFFEKICLVKVVNNMSKGPQKQKVPNQLEQSFHQDDFVKISESIYKIFTYFLGTAKIVEYDRKRGIVFLINKEKPTKTLRLYSIKLKHVENGNSDSEEEKSRKHNQNFIVDHQSGFEFGFIKEMILNLNNQVLQAINTGPVSKKPKFMKIIRKPFSLNQEEMFYIYTSIGGQILVHAVPYTELIENQDKIRSYAEGNNVIKQALTGGTSLFDQDILKQLTENQQYSFSDPHNHESDSQPPLFGVIPTIEKKRKSKLLDEQHQQQPKVNNFMGDEMNPEQQQLENDLKEERELVNMELEKAITDDLRDFENPAIIIQEELKNDVELIQPKSKITPDQQKVAESMKQHQQQNAQPVGKKKKGKTKKGNNNNEVQGRTSGEKQPLKQAQSQVMATQQQQQQFFQQIFTNKPPQQQPQPMQTFPPQQQYQQPMPMQQQQQNKGSTRGEQLIEQYSDLAKRYQDVAIKLQKLQEQIQSQGNQQLELDKCIQKHIKQILPQILEEQLKSQVVPMVIQHLKGLDKSIKDEILPVIEGQIDDIFSKLIESKQILPNQNQVAIGGQVNEQQIKIIVMNEFQSAMEKQIKPMLQEQFKLMIEDVQGNLSTLNEEFVQRLRNEEEKNQHLLKFYKEKLEQMVDYQNIQQNSNSMTAMPLMYNPTTMAPHPYMHPGAYYPPPPPGYAQQFMGGYIPTQQPQIPLTKEVPNKIVGSQNKQLQKKQLAMSDFHKRTSAQQGFNPINIQQLQLNSNHKSYMERKASNQLIEFSDDDNNEAKKLQRYQNYEPEYVGVEVDGDFDQDNQQQESNTYSGGIIAQTSLGNQPVLMFNDEEIPSNSRRQSGKMKGENQIQFQQQQLKFQKSIPISASNSISNPPLMDRNILTKQASISVNDVGTMIKYIKDVANGKSSQLDIIFNSQGQLDYLTQLLTMNPQFLTGQHPNIIYQFMKKISDRAKENPYVRKESYQLFKLLYGKVCLMREDLRVRLTQLKQMGEELKTLADSQQQQ